MAFSLKTYFHSYLPLSSYFPITPLSPSFLFFSIAATTPNSFYDYSHSTRLHSSDSLYSQLALEDPLLSSKGNSHERCREAILKF